MTSPLQEQLLRRSIDATALADAGIERARAEELLSGADPTINEVRRIASQLNIPVRPLIASRKGYGNQENFRLRENFRSKSLATDEILQLVEKSDFLLSGLHAPTRRVSFALKADDKTFGISEDIAAIFRSEVLKVDGLVPLIDLESRMHEATNVTALVLDLRRIEGGIISHPSQAFIFLAARPDPRMRFTLAHEICHYLVDSGATGTDAWFDEDALRPSGNFRRDENFANSFASALLLPRAGVGEMLNIFRETYSLRNRDVSDVEIALLSRFYGVSFQVAARRLEDLKLLPRGGGQSIYEEIQKTFKSPEVFANKIGLPDRVTYNWRQANVRVVKELQRAIDEGDISVGQLSELVEMPIGELVGLVPK